FSLATSAARSSMARGFWGIVCAMTARVSGSIFRIAWQQGHSTSNMFSEYHRPAQAGRDDCAGLNGESEENLSEVTHRRGVIRGSIVSPKACSNLVTPELEQSPRQTNSPRGISVLDAKRTAKPGILVCKIGKAVST